MTSEKKREYKSWRRYKGSMNENEILCSYYNMMQNDIAKLRNWQLQATASNLYATEYQVYKDSIKELKFLEAECKAISVYLRRRGY